MNLNQNCTYFSKRMNKRWLRTAKRASRAYAADHFPTGQHGNTVPTPNPHSPAKRGGARCGGRRRVPPPIHGAQGGARRTCARCTAAGRRVSNPKPAAGPTRGSEPPGRMQRPAGPCQRDKADVTSWVCSRHPPYPWCKPFPGRRPCACAGLVF